MLIIRLTKVIVLNRKRESKSKPRKQLTVSNSDLRKAICLQFNECPMKKQIKTKKAT